MEATEPFSLFECSLVRPQLGEYALIPGFCWMRYIPYPTGFGASHDAVRLEDPFRNCMSFLMIWPAGAGTRLEIMSWANNSV